MCGGGFGTLFLLFCAYVCMLSYMEAGLEVDVQHPGLLAFDGAEGGVQPPEDAPARHGVAAERVRAGPVGIPAVRASGAVANAEEVSERQLHQGAEAVRAGYGVFGQRGATIVVGRQLRGECFRAQAVELHVQVGLAAALCGAAGRGLLAEAGVGLPGAGEAQHHRVVSLGRGEGHEERGAVADPVGVGLVAHGLAHLVGPGGVPAARRRVVQDLPAAVVVVESCNPGSRMQVCPGWTLLDFFLCCDYRVHVSYIATLW